MRIYIVSKASGEIAGYETHFRHAVELGKSLGESYVIDRLVANFKDANVDTVGTILLAGLAGYAKELARVLEKTVDVVQEQPHDAPIDQPTVGE